MISRQQASRLIRYQNVIHRLDSQPLHVLVEWAHSINPQRPERPYPEENHPKR